MELQRQVQLQAQNKLDNGEKVSRERGEDAFDRIYIFCPEYDDGLVFSDRSPLSELDWHVISPSFDFVIFDEAIAEWSENVNGIKDNNMAVEQGAALLVREVPIPTHEDGMIVARTVIVSRENFEKIVEQIRNQVERKVDGQKRIHLDCRVINCLGVNVLGKNTEFKEADGKTAGNYIKDEEEEHLNKFIR